MGRTAGKPVPSRDGGCPKKPPRSRGGVVTFFGFPLGGLAASLLIRRRTASASQWIAATIMATVGCGLTGLIVIFSLISMQARIDPAWGALAWGLGFGIGGALSGPSLSWLWLPADARSNRVRFAGVIAWPAFAFSGAIAGFLGFQGFLALHFYSVSLCVWLAYLLGGLLCERGWQRSLARSDAQLEEGGRSKSRSQLEEEAAVSASDPERRARNSMEWSIVALSLLVFLGVKVRWPMPWADIILFTLWLVPLLMLGIREVSLQAVSLLVVLGAPRFLGSGRPAGNAATARRHEREELAPGSHRNLGRSALRARRHAASGAPGNPTLRHPVRPGAARLGSGHRQLGRQQPYSPGQHHDGPVGLARRSSGRGQVLHACRGAHTRIAPAQLRSARA